ncbi:MAG: sigma-70 family RNA polymerase sigma factor, partial [Candidatus Magnetominusculus sp. LBB02]|nr:sigma-70 family RNA polymerase sigma factor [Candidatus Magnetominusculus sp. LBB02]
MDEDNRLIDSYLKEGDESALEGLVIKYRKEVYLVAYRVAGDVEDAKDIAQKAFINAVAKLRDFKRQSSFRTWLYRIAVNAALNHVRGNGHKTEELPETLQSEDKGAVSHMIEKEQE